MDSSELSLPPPPPAGTFQMVSSNGPCKRSIHEVDDPAIPPASSKRTLTGYAEGNQENCDPTVSISEDTAISSEKQNDTTPSFSTAETLVQQVDLSHSNTESLSANAPTAPLNATHCHESTPPVQSSTPLPIEKNQKVSPIKKGAKQQEKEAKERQKIEERLKREEERRLKADEKKRREAMRDEERRLKEEEKKKREAEREEKKKSKEEEKAAKEAAKEDEKRRKEEAKLKKERAQPKLNSFFARPALPSVSSRTVKQSPSPGKSGSNGDSHSDTAAQPFQSNYAKEFPEFFVLSHTVVAPIHRFERDSKALEHVRQTLDECMKSSNRETYQHRPFRPSEVFNMIPYRRRRGRRTYSVKEILLRMQNNNDEIPQSRPVSDDVQESDPRQLLCHIPIKLLKFHEDVRPPYQGTFTRFVPESSVVKVSRNPYHRVIPDINYDYDSEAEWEEPEEGEELESEEEEEGSDDGEDDLEGFLDDEDDALAGGKRRLIVGDLEPVCSGIRWASDGVDPEFKAYHIQTISDAVQFPIDPFSSAYWQTPHAPEPATKGPAALTPASRIQTLGAFRISAKPDTPTIGGALLAVPSKAKRPFPPELLGEFKQVVETSELNKIGTVEILKKRFPKVSKETLKVTLDQLAVRVGQKEADKKWVFR